MFPDSLLREVGVLNGVRNPVARLVLKVRYGFLRIAPVLTAVLRIAGTYLPFMDALDEPLIMTGEQVAELLQVSPRTVEEWRQTHSGPPFRRVGRHVRYLRVEVLDWFRELVRHG